MDPRLKLVLEVYPVPVGASACLFFCLWYLLRHRAALHGAEVQAGSWPDASILGIAYSIGHFSLNPWTGLPPNVSQDWLPIGVLAASAVSLLPVPRAVLWPALVAIAVATIGLMLDGLTIFKRDYPLETRLLVFLPIALASLAAAGSQVALARRFPATDFFILNGLLCTIFAATVGLNYTGEALARSVLIPAAIAAPAFIIAIIGRPRHVSAPFAFLWQLIISAILAYAYFSKYETPPAHSLALLLAAPLIATPLLSIQQIGWRARAVAYPLAIAAAALGFLASSPTAPDEDGTDDGYGDLP